MFLILTCIILYSYKHILCCELMKLKLRQLGLKWKKFSENKNTPKNSGFRTMWQHKSLVFTTWHKLQQSASVSACSWHHSAWFLGLMAILSTQTQMGGNSSGSAVALQSESKYCLASALITKSKLEPREKCNSGRMARHRGGLAAGPVCLFFSPVSLLTQTSFVLQQNHQKTFSNLQINVLWLSLIYFTCGSVMSGFVK